ncbi:MAG TPA: chemotaxis protein CheB [Polyangiaceae bacterium]
MPRKPIEAIVIGGSAGGLSALSTLLSGLPADFRLPIAAVLHVPPTRHAMLAEVLAGRCPLAVREAEDKEPLAAGTVYIAAPNYHLLIEKTRTFSLSVDDPVNFSRPAIDVLFESAAYAYGPALAGVVLTGASADGALGLLRIAEAGGTALVQHPDTAAARVMPEAALRSVPAARVVRIEDMAASLLDLTATRALEET